MSSQVDEDILKLSDKILTTILVILTSLLNLGLIIFLIFKGSVTRSPRRYIIGSVSFANLFLALFTIVVREVYLFDEDDVTCKTGMLAWTYYLLHIFVTGLSIVALCGELLFREKIRSVFNRVPIIVGIVLGGAPWILGLIIVLPLNLAGFNFDRCLYDFIEYLNKDQQERLYNRYRANYYVSGTLPLGAVVLTSVVIILIKVKVVAEFYDNDNTNTRSTYQNSIILQSTPWANLSAPDYAPLIPFPISDLNDDNQYSTASAPTTISVISSNQHQLLLHDNPGPTIPTNQSEPASNYIPGPISAFTEMQAPYTVAQSKQDVLREKVLIVVMSWVFAFMFLPVIILELAYHLRVLEPENRMSQLAEISVSRFFLYQSYSWGIVFPFMSFLYVHNSKYPTRI